MQLNSQQLQRQWQQQPAPIYWIAGEELLQKQELKQQLRELARAAGYTEREVYYSNQDFQWEQLLDAGSSMSLFGDKKFIELNLDKLPDKKAQQILLHYSANLPQDTLLIIDSPKVDKRIQKNKWFQQLEACMGFIAVWPLEGQQLAQGLQQRAQQLGFSLERDAAHWLAQQVEGNLLAAKNELEKLALLLADQNSPITLDILQQQIVDQARFDVFKLMEAMLEGNATQACRILASIKNEGVSEMSVLGILGRELRILHQLAIKQAAGAIQSSDWRSLGIWGARQGNYLQCLRRYPARIWPQLVAKLLQVERVFKGLEQGNCWSELEKFILFIAGVRLSL